MLKFDPIVVDNFYETPTMVRNFALNQGFFKRPGNYPGLRTDQIAALDVDLYHIFGQKICGHIFKNLAPDEKVEYSFRTSFQIGDSKYRTGWIHHDVDGPDGVNVAGVVYLTPNPVANCGTSLYIPNDITTIRDEFLPADPFLPTDTISRGVSYDNYWKTLERHNSQFTRKAQYSNVFNRMVCYSPYEWHAQDGWFGGCLKTSRMIQVFFGSLKVVKK